MPIDEIVLTRSVYPWYEANGIYVCGYGYYNGKYLEKSELLNYFGNISSAEMAANLVTELDGFFSIIAKLDTGVFIAVDRLRSIPIFYAKTGDNWFITDSLGLREKERFGLDERAVSIFSQTLECLSSKTYLKNVYQQAAGSYVVLGENGEKTEKYYRSEGYEEQQIKDMSQATTLLKESYDESFRRLVRYIGDRIAVVPLSGGHDSRLILYYLKKYNCKKIIAYSYGIPGNEESICAQKVAAALGVDFYFVDYSDRRGEKWMKQNFKNYALFAGNMSSVPHAQEPYAVAYLKENGIIDDDCVFIPGFSGDFMAGGYLLVEQDDKQYSKDYLINSLINRHASEVTRKRTSPISDSLLEEFRQHPLLRSCEDSLTSKKCNEIFEHFNLVERQAKFIQNAVKAYEFSGYKWATPFFDNIQFSAWSKIDNSLRKEKRAFTETEKLIYDNSFITIPFASSYGMSITNTYEKIIAYLTKYSLPRHIIYLFSRGRMHYLFKLFSQFDYMKMCLSRKNLRINNMVYLKYFKCFNKK